MTIKKGKMKLRPRARIIKILGEDLISNNNVAFIELIKNSYDADATNVVISFKNSLLKDKGIITIEDNGHGMDIKTIKEGWMEPASIIKKIEKHSLNKKRRFLGEKGVGRFATSKLSKKLQIITRKNKDEIEANFDWHKFYNEEKYLDQIDCSWETRNPITIKTCGTLLTMSKINQNWNLERLKSLRISLSRLISPFQKVKDFNISIELPNLDIKDIANLEGLDNNEELQQIYKQYKDIGGRIDSPEILKNPHYKIQGKTDGTGKTEILYYSKEKKDKEKIIIDCHELKKPKRTPSCGPFKFEFRVWDLDRLETLATDIYPDKDSKLMARDIRDDLKESAGVSIYRDSFRVLPYGDTDSDWLKLNFRRVQNPTMRLSSNQVVGFISISLDDNPQLLDQSNREGIIDSQGFKDLKDIIIIIIRELEDRRYKERPRKEEKRETPASLFSQINIDQLEKEINKKLPRDKEVKIIIKKTHSAIDKGIKGIKNVLARYRRLSTLGMLVDMVLHEGNSFIVKIDGATEILKNEIGGKSMDIKEVGKQVDSIDNQNNIMGEMFKKLEPFSGKSRKEKKKIIIEDSINDIFQLFGKKLKKNKIEYKISNTKTEHTIRESDFEIIITNLLTNSIHWLDDAKSKKINVKISSENDCITVSFNDSGLGVKDDDIPFIFDPYYSKKLNGVGLGLTIAGELVLENNGDLELTTGGTLPGANFVITFYNSKQHGKNKYTIN